MKKNYLIFTPINNTWPANYQNYLSFVSESAILNLDGKQNKYKSIYINSSRWKNKKIFGKDYHNLSNLFEKILKILSKELNNIHEINNDQKTWRLILGPWLSMFIFVFFERYSNLKKIVKKKKIDKCIFLNFDKNLFVPYNNREFIHLASEDYWNQFFYQKLCENFIKKKKIEIIKAEKNKEFQKFKKNIKRGKYLNQNFGYPKNFLIRFLNLFNRKKYKYLFFGNNLGIKNEFNLSFKFNQFPTIGNIDNTFVNRKINEKLRKKIKKRLKFKNIFEDLCLKSICDFLPTLFLENYKDFKKYQENKNLPTSPKVVLLSHSLWFDTKFMYYIANLLRNKKTKLIYCQHGGTYGLAAYNWLEKFEISIANIYLTWGWMNKINKNLKKFFILKNMKLNISRKKNLLVIMRNRFRYLYSMESSISLESYSDYIFNISTFLKNINNNVKEKTIIRMPQGTNKKHNFCEKLFEHHTFKNNKSFAKACSESKLIIHTYNSTPFLETLSANIPSILILDKNSNPFKKESRKLISNLEKNKILFFKMKEAALFVNKLWNSNKINDWWNSKKTQNAINMFTNIYAKKTDDIPNEIKRIILSTTLKH